MNQIEDKYSFEVIAFPVNYKDIDILQRFNQICVMAYGLDDVEIVVLSKQGDYEYILMDIVYLLRVEIEEISHYVEIKNAHVFTFEP